MYLYMTSWSMLVTQKVLKGNSSAHIVNIKMLGSAKFHLRSIYRVCQYLHLGSLQENRMVEPNKLNIYDGRVTRNYVSNSKLFFG